MNKLQRIGLGGGCHWCTEGVFVSLPGVSRVEQGWIAAPPPDDAYSEAVIVHFDPTLLDLPELIAVHVETHSAGGDHRLRHRYRSAVYAFDNGQLRRVEFLLGQLEDRYPDRLLTRGLRFAGFRHSLPEHRDYFRRGPDRPFCRRYIAPKVERLRADRPYLFLPNEQ